MAALKIEGALPHLDVLVMKFAPPMGMRMIGQPPLSLDELKAGVEKQLGSMVTKAKLELKFEESS